MKCTKVQANAYLVNAHGLGPVTQYRGKAGILSLVDKLGCIQYDPVDVCGKNHQLVLQARVEDFSKEDVDELLYGSRDLVDGWDNNMSVYSMSDWPCFSRVRHSASLWRRRQDILEAMETVMETIENQGPLSSLDFEKGIHIDWAWGKTREVRAALEQLYHEGRITIHHRVHTRKYYDLSSRLIPDEIIAMADPHPTDDAYWDWRLLRRVASVGLIRDRGSDAFLGIEGLSAKQRHSAFARLENAGKIERIQVEGINHDLLRVICDREPGQLDPVEPGKMRFLAPLDNLLWDRHLIEALFDFKYRWEIYTPKSKRQFGGYVLPIMAGERFVGRIALSYDHKKRALDLTDLWWENGMASDKTMQRLLDEALMRFEAWHQK